jgi:co-chaperonin GroES (HSP10)|tara:strand:+ start:372 stop:629 length:258 start_codon:yes stop_codon:yes gene_type:complete
MKAINYYIIIEKIKEEPKTVNGLLITDDIKKDVRYSKGKVISFGEETKGLKKDDIIYYNKHAGHGIEFDNKLFHVIKQQDVVVVL